MLTEDNVEDALKVNNAKYLCTRELDAIIKLKEKFRVQPDGM